MATKALGSLIRITAKERLTRYHYYLPVSDLLMDIVEQSPNSEEAQRLAEIAHSFAHDVLNLAVLGGRLLWCESLLPDTSQLPDLVSASTDAESYFLILKSACDLLADAGRHFGFAKNRLGQVPSGSLNDLNNWVKNNRDRTLSNFCFLGDKIPWFVELRVIRTNLAHRGYDLNILSDRVRLHFMVTPYGKGAVREAQREQGQTTQPRVHRFTPLLPKLQDFTTSMLKFSERLAEAIRTERNLKEPSKSHLLNGVYVPALHHLTSYTAPNRSRQITFVARLLKNYSGYREAAEVGFPDDYWWAFVVCLLDRFEESRLVIGKKSHASTGELVDWKIVCLRNEKKYGISTRDTLLNEDVCWKKMATHMQEFVNASQLDNAILVARKITALHKDKLLPKLPFGLVIEQNPRSAAEKAYSELVKQDTHSPERKEGLPTEADQTD